MQIMKKLHSLSVQFLCLTLPMALLTSCGFIDGGAGKIAQKFIDVDAEKYQSNVQPYNVDNTNLVTIKLDEPEEDKVLKLSEFIESIDFVPLDNDPKATIGDITKLIIDDNKMFILDKDRAKCLKVFDMQGKLLYSVGRTGRGPQEYTQPSDFTVYGNEVEIYDQFTGKLLTYSTANGKFIRERRVPFIAHAVKRFNDSTYLFHAIDAQNQHLGEILGNSLLETDTNFVVRYAGSYREPDKYRSYTHYLKNLTHPDNRVCYLEPRTSLMQEVASNGKIKNLYNFDFGDLNFPGDPREKDADKHNQYTEIITALDMPSYIYAL